MLRGSLLAAPYISITAGQSDSGGNVFMDDTSRIDASGAGIPNDAIHTAWGTNGGGAGMYEGYVCV